MQRISSWTDLVAALGRFRYGSVVGGISPTPLKAEWLNMVQEELANFILAYLPNLDVNDDKQLLKAIQAFGSAYALKATTLAGYGIGDAYTKNQTDFLLSGKANWGITLAAYGIGDAYTKGAVDGLLAAKAPLASPVLSGIPEAPTAPYGTNSKQLATCEFVQFGLSAAYPVGSVYINAGVATNPATLLGFGTWVAMAPGRMLIGAGTGTDTRGEERAFALGEQSGEYNHLLSIAEMPAHTHTNPQGAVGGPPGNLSSGDDLTSAVYSNPDSSSTGGSEAHNNVSPYLVVHMWRRTA